MIPFLQKKKLRVSEAHSVSLSSPKCDELEFEHGCWPLQLWILPLTL